MFRTLLELWAPDNECEFLKGIPKKYVMLMSVREELSNVMDIEYTREGDLGMASEN